MRFGYLTHLNTMPAAYDNPALAAQDADSPPHSFAAEVVSLLEGDLTGQVGAGLNPTRNDLLAEQPGELQVGSNATLRADHQPTLETSGVALPAEDVRTS